MTSDLEILPDVARVLDAQDAYRARSPSVLPRAVRSVTAPLNTVANRLIPPDVIEAAIRGADWVAAASIRDQTISHDFANLDACEAAARDVRRWSLAYAATGGGAAGAFGAAGLAFDIPATMTLALRTARLIGLSYGFGQNDRREQVYILDILQLAAANSQTERDAALARLAEGRAAMDRDDWQKVAEMTGHASGASAAIQRVALTLGANLSARKVAQVMPVVGAVVGASVNAAFQNDVADAAQFAFRARWLEVNEQLLDHDRGLSPN